MGYYTITTGTGDEVTTGVSEERIDEVAQRAADRLGETVYVSGGEQEYEVAPCLRPASEIPASVGETATEWHAALSEDCQGDERALAAAEAQAEHIARAVEAARARDHVAVGHALRAAYQAEREYGDWPSMQAAARALLLPGYEVSLHTGRIIERA